MVFDYFDRSAGSLPAGEAAASRLWRGEGRLPSRLQAGSLRSITSAPAVFATAACCTKPDGATQSSPRTSTLR